MAFFIQRYQESLATPWSLLEFQGISMLENFKRGEVINYFPELNNFRLPTETVLDWEIKSKGSMLGENLKKVKVRL